MDKPSLGQVMQVAARAVKCHFFESDPYTESACGAGGEPVAVALVNTGYGWKPECEAHVLGVEATIENSMRRVGRTRYRVRRIPAVSTVAA